jgi:hypothetical protein
MANTITTTGSKIAVVADWSGFVIADRIGATALIAGWTVGAAGNAKASAALPPSCLGAGTGGVGARVSIPRAVRPGFFARGK